jgi:hypothetical protein
MSNSNVKELAIIKPDMVLKKTVIGTNNSPQMKEQCTLVPKNNSTINYNEKKGKKRKPYTEGENISSSPKDK